MAKRKRSKDPGVGSLIPSSRDRVDLPQGMNSKPGDNDHLSRWGRWKTKIANLWSWLSYLWFIIPLVGLLVSIYFNFKNTRHYKETIFKIESHYKEIIRQNKESISFITNILQEQNKFLERLRIEGNLPSDMMTSIEPPRNGAPVSRGSIKVALADIAAKQFIVSGNLDRIIKGKRLWIGTLSGLRFWPQIELPPDIREGVLFKYRVTIPPNIASGELVLMEAGSQANKLFRDQMIGQYYRVGLFWPHLKDAQVIAPANFQ